MQEENKDIEKDIEKFVKLTKEEMAASQPSDADLICAGESQIVLFKGKEIRQIFYNDEWFFSIVDVIEAITESESPSRYWTELRNTLKNEGSDELFGKIEKLKLLSKDGKMRSAEVVNTEALFRIVQSIPSSKAEPFKKWLAKVAYERIQEFQNPEIAIKRAILTYKVKGYSDDWINARIQTIVSRKELTTEWSQRGIIKGLEFALLTDFISLCTFELKTKEHKEVKGLKSQNLRDHMTPLELALTMLGETTTAEFARTSNAQGFNENKEAAISGGGIAGEARKNIEKKLGKKVVTGNNFIKLSSKAKNKIDHKNT